MNELTKLEQKFVYFLENAEFIDMNTIKEINKRENITTPNMTFNITSSLVKKGALIRIKKGRFYKPKTLNIHELFIIGSVMFDGYIALNNALFYYGCSSSLTNSIQVATPYNRRKTRKIKDITFIGVPFGGKCFGSTRAEDFLISTKAKTLFDCIYKINEVDDLTGVFRLVKIMKKNDFEEFLNILTQINKNSIYEKAGYVLETASAAKNVINKISKNIKNKVITNLGKKMNRGLFISKWSVYDNIQIKRFTR